MTIEELYMNIGGSYEDVSTRLQNEEKIPRYVCAFPEDKTFDAFINAYNEGKDENVIFEIIHTYKGVCQNLSFVKLCDIAIPLTEHYRGRNEYRFDDVDAQVKELSRRHANVLEQIAIFASQK